MKEKLDELDEKIIAVILLSGLYFYINDQLIQGIFVIVFGLSLYLAKDALLEKYPDFVLLFKKHTMKLEVPVLRSGDIVIGTREIDAFGYLVLNLEHLHHTMVVSMTRYGKSTVLETLLYQMVMRFSPDELEIAIVDPGKESFRIFENVPHLRFPVARDGDTLIFLQQIEDEINSRKTLFKQIPKELKVDDIEDFKSAVQRLNLDYPIPKPLFVFIDELHVLVARKDHKEKLDFIHRVGAGFGVKVISAAHRATSDSLSKASQSEISTKFIGHQESNKNYAYAGVEKEIRDRAIHKAGHFITFVDGFWGYCKVTKIPQKLLEERIKAINIKHDWSQTQSTPIIIKQEYRGSNEIKESLVMGWFLDNNFIDKPTPEMFRIYFDVSEPTAYKAINGNWETYKAMKGINTTGEI